MYRFAAAIVIVFAKRKVLLWIQQLLRSIVASLWLKDKSEAIKYLKPLTGQGHANAQIAYGGAVIYGW
jgi:hypothetical protein